MTFEIITPFELEEHRRDAESRMWSRATVRRKGAKTRNVDGTVSAGWTTILTGVPFRLGGSHRGGGGYRTVRIGEVEMQVAVRTGHMPAATTGLADLDFIDVTSGENAGVVLCIAETSGQDQATALRMPVFEVQRPAEWV